MFVQSIEVKNFRCLKDVTVQCDNLTAFLGRNGAGKSSILQALEIFYDVSFLSTEEDYCNRNTEEPIVIRVTYRDLSASEQDEFRPYIKDQLLSVTKRIPVGDRGQYYAATMQVPQFAEIRQIPNKTDIRSKYNVLKKTKAFESLPAARNAGECEANMVAFESSHPDLCELTEKQEQFFGPSNIGGGKLDKYTRYVMVPAVKEVSDELAPKGKTYLQQLLDLVVLRQVESRDDVKKLKENFEQEVKRVYSSDNLTELPVLGQGISTILNRYAPGAEFHLDWGEVKPPSIQLPPATASLTEDGFRGDIGRKGHGLQRSLIFALLEYLNKLSPADTGGDGDEDQGESESLSLILGIEEPELYQHPLRSRFLSKLLFDLAASGENQIMYTTHSPFFVDLNRYDQIRLVRKIESGEDCLKHGTVTCCSEDGIIEKVSHVSERPIDECSMEGFRARASAVMDSVANEGFFADAVVVVEGLSDYGCLWALQDVLNLDWAGQGIAIVPASGKNNIEKPTLIFREFSIPTYFIFDSDSSHRGKRQEQSTIQANRRLLRLAGATEVDFPETRIAETWACFGNDLEHCLKEGLGDSATNEVADVIKDELGYTRNKEVFKNIEGMTRFIQVAYDKGHTVSHLEELARKISSMIN